MIKTMNAKEIFERLEPSELLRKGTGPVNPQTVRYAVDCLRGMAGDDEAAHSAEDRLHRAVMAAIDAGECEDPKECARIVMGALK